MATASGIVDPPACALVITKYMTSIPKTTTITPGVYHWRHTRTIYNGGFLQCSLRRDFSLWQRCGILNFRGTIFFTSYSTGFVTIPGQIGGFPVSHKSVDHPCKISDLHNYSGDHPHLQG
jgi:hypothetical protein